MSTRVSGRVEDYQFDADVRIFCGCGAAFWIGRRAIANNCPRCRRLYRVTIQVLEEVSSDV